MNNPVPPRNRSSSFPNMKSYDTVFSRFPDLVVCGATSYQHLFGKLTILRAKRISPLRGLRRRRWENRGSAAGLLPGHALGKTRRRRPRFGDTRAGKLGQGPFEQSMTEKEKMRSGDSMIQGIRSFSGLSGDMPKSLYAGLQQPRELPGIRILRLLFGFCGENARVESADIVAAAAIFPRHRQPYGS